MPGVLRWFTITTTLSCIAWQSADGQQFHFGGSVAVIASQVDGDNLRGFNKPGFCGGLFTGFALSSASSVVVELQYAAFGSRQRKEQQAFRLETHLGTINVLIGYSLRFGDAWDGDERFQLLVGPRIYVIHSATLGASHDRDPLHRYFVSAYIGLGVMLTDHIQLDLSYTHAMSNILRKEVMGFERLVPYYLGLGATYLIGGCAS